MFYDKPIHWFLEWDENCIKIEESESTPDRKSDTPVYFINSKKEILYPYTTKKGFDIIDRPDIHGVHRVGIVNWSLPTSGASGWYEYNGIKYIKKAYLGLFSSKGKFPLPMEYDELRYIDCDDIWICHKGDDFLIIQTDDND